MTRQDRYNMSATEKTLPLLEQLEDLLPHGSSINGSWHIETTNGTRFYCHNTYEAMTEYGMYCHDYDFTAVYDYWLNQPVPLHPPEYGEPRFCFVRLSMHGAKERSCCGYGLRDYLEDTLYDLYI